MKVEWKERDHGGCDAKVCEFTLFAWGRDWVVSRMGYTIFSGTSNSNNNAQRAAERALTKLIEDAVKAKEIAG